MSKRTPGKWESTKITTEQGIRMAGGYKFSIWVDTSSTASYRSVSVAFVREQANAEFIVQACNSYDSMLDVLKVMAANPNGLYVQYGQAVSDRVKSAIAQAEAKE